jgi:hypothetical protein
MRAMTSIVAAAALAIGSAAFYGCSDNNRSPDDSGRYNSQPSGATGTVNPDQSTGDYNTNNARPNRNQQNNMDKTQGNQNENMPSGSPSNQGTNNGTDNGGTSGSGATGGGDGGM